MKTLRIAILNPKAETLLRNLASMELISIVPKRQPETPAVNAKRAERETQRTPLERYDALCRRMDAYQRKNGLDNDTMTIEEICEDIREYRREKYAQTVAD